MNIYNIYIYMNMYIKYIYMKFIYVNILYIFFIFWREHLLDLFLGCEYAYYST